MGQPAWVFRADENVFLTARESPVDRTKSPRRAVNEPLPTA